MNIDDVLAIFAPKQEVLEVQEKRRVEILEAQGTLVLQGFKPREVERLVFHRWMREQERDGEF